MALTEKLQMVLTLDSKDAVKGFESVGKAADRELKRTTSNIDKVGAGMRKAGAAMLTIGGIAAVGLWKAGEAASDLAEAANVTGLISGSCIRKTRRSSTPFFSSLHSSSSWRAVRKPKASR